MKRILAITCALALCISSSVFASYEGLDVVFQNGAAEVQVEGGMLRGYIDDGVYTYKGVPYATAERFQEPQKVAPWEGIKNAQIYGDMCPQADMSAGAAEAINPHLFWPEAKDETKIQTLNVWTTDMDPEAKKPVMFWIHGGGFSSGASTEQIAYDGRNMALYGDVVVVSINHRLNVLGFLDLSAYGEEFAHSGNLGQMDIVAALQWVKDNIAQFGGDPENVTVFGQSGGGRKILMLMASPYAQGLFAKAICESCGRQSVTQEAAQAVAAKTLEKLGLDAESVAEIKTVDYDALADAANAAISEYNQETGDRYAWSPVVDGDFLPKDIWLEDSVSSDDCMDIPMIIGSVFAERTTNAFAYAFGAPSFLDEMTDEDVDALLTQKYGDKKDAVIAAFQEAYPEKPIVESAYVDLTAYRGIVLDVANRKAAMGGAPVYNYVFSYRIPTLGGWLPWHCSEIPFVFHNLEKVKLTYGVNEEELRLQDNIFGAWMAFAHTGDPNFDGIVVDWPAYTVEEGAAMIWDGDASLIGYHHDAGLMDVILGE